MENDKEYSTRNEDVNSKRAELLKELYALKNYVKSTSNNAISSDNLIQGSTRSNDYVSSVDINSGSSNTNSKRISLNNGGQKYFGNQDSGFANALVLGIIVFLTETLFLLIGYLLFK